LNSFCWGDGENIYVVERLDVLIPWFAGHRKLVTDVFSYNIFRKKYDPRCKYVSE
jgi:hypothetical protein